MGYDFVWIMWWYNMCICFRLLLVKFEDVNVKLLEFYVQIVWEFNLKFWFWIDWVVGLDFGIIYSGFVYVKVVVDELDIYVFYDWLWKENERFYCKILIGFFYKWEVLFLLFWGYCV